MDFSLPLLNPLRIEDGSLILHSSVVYFLCGLWIAFEVIFWVLIHYGLVPKLQPLNKPLNYPGCELELICKILDTLDSLGTYSFEKFVSGFFRGANIKDLKEENVVSFLCWAMFGARKESLDTIQIQKVSIAYKLVCDRYNLNLPSGHNSDVQHVCMTWETISFIHRPLFLYVASGLMQILTTAILFRMRGFHSHHFRNMHYWFHPGPSKNGHSLDPVLFLHGITPGWLGYGQIVLALAKGRPIFLIDLEGIRIKSMKFSMPDPEVFALSVKAILKRHRFDKASVVGHSFGTITAAWIIKHRPEIVSHLTLLDPVSLLLCLPDVAYAFVYRSPKSFVEWIIYLFASKELTISYALHRNFSWYRNVLWFDEIPRSIGVVVGIAGSDEVANAATIYEYTKNWQTRRLNESSTDCDKTCSAAPIELLLWPKFSHGQILLSQSAQTDLVETLLRSEKALKVQN